MRAKRGSPRNPRSAGSSSMRSVRAASLTLCTGSPPVRPEIARPFVGMDRRGPAATGNDDFARMKQATVRFYLDQIVPEALGLKAAAVASAEALYALDAEAFAA